MPAFTAFVGRNVMGSITVLAMLITGMVRDAWMEAKIS